MAYPVTLNGRTYTLADFEGTNYVEGLPDAFEDFVTHAGDIYNSTSTTSNTIGTGSKTFTVESAKPYQAGTPLRIADAAAPSTNFMDCIVTSYSGTTLVVDAVGYAGSGTFTSWNVNIGGAASVAGTVAIAQGGTGATTAAAARTNLDVYSKADADSRFLNVSGEASDVTMTGNVTIGDAAGDTLSVPATASFSGGISGDVAFDTDTLFVDATNNEVGIGTSSPSATLNVSNDAGGSNSWTNAGSAIIINEEDTTKPASIKFGPATASQGGQIVWGGVTGDGPFVFRNYSGERLRIDADGRVLIGHDQSINQGRHFQITGLTSDTSGMELSRFNNGGGGVTINLSKSRSTTNGSPGTVVNTGDDLGAISFMGDDGTDMLSVAANIMGEVDGTAGTDDMPGRLTFWTTADGSNSPTERMRITQAGSVDIGFTSSDVNGKLNVKGDVGIRNFLATSNPTGGAFSFTDPDSSTILGILRVGDDDGSTSSVADLQIISYGSADNDGGGNIRFINSRYSKETGLIKSSRQSTNTGYMDFYTENGSGLQKAMRIDSSQRVLIGTTSALSTAGGAYPRFQVAGSSFEQSSMFLGRGAANANASGLNFVKSRNANFGGQTILQNNDQAMYIAAYGDDGTDNNTPMASIVAEVDGTPGANDMPGRIRFSTTADGASGTTERMRITNDGKVLISSTGGGTPGAQLQVSYNDSSTSHTAQGQTPNGLRMYNANTTTNALTSISFAAPNAGTALASINMVNLNAFSASTTCLGDLTFSTKQSGSSILTERMRIRSDGIILIGRDSTLNMGSNSNTGTQIYTNGQLDAYRNSNPALHVGRQGNNGPVVKFACQGTADVGSIDVTTSSTSYTTSSDYRLKENIVELTNATDRLKQLQPKRFNFTVDSDTTVDGFLAHEVSDIVPEAIRGTKDEVDADGNPVYQGIDQSKLVPLLVATIKELEARITALEAS